MPDGAAQAAVSRSYSQAAVRSPRLPDTVVCSGPSTCMPMNTTATASSGPATPEPRSTAATSTPVAIAKQAGSRPRAVSSPHQVAAIRRSACHSAAASRISCRFRTRARAEGGASPLPVMDFILPEAAGHAQPKSAQKFDKEPLASPAGIIIIDWASAAPRLAGRRRRPAHVRCPESSQLRRVSWRGRGCGRAAGSRRGASGREAARRRSRRPAARPPRRRVRGPRARPWACRCGSSPRPR